MFNRLRQLLAPPESKSSRTARLVAFESGGRARWTPRDYAGLAREGYLANAIVHRSVRLIAENAAACQFLVFENAAEREAHPLAQLLTRPNPRQDGGVFFEMLYAHLLLAGNAYVEAVALGETIRELYALRPDRMKVVPGADGWAEAYEYCVGGRSVRFDQLGSKVPPILHLTFFHPLDDHYGLAPIEAAAVAVDAAIQIAVLDLNRTAPPASPAEGERHVVASGATGAWAGQANAIATWQDGAWAFLEPRIGWCIWSVADNVVFVFDGTHWRDLRDLPVTLDNAVHVGINTTASSPNLLSVKSNAALLSAIATADGGSGDARLQISKENASKTASVFFSDAFSGRAEFGLVGSDAFKLKVSADGSAWVEAFDIDQSTGNLALPRGLTLSGVVAPAQITANQNNYNPTGVATASVLQLSSDASRSISGLSGGAEGRVISIINVGSQPITLLDENAASTAANRFTLGGDMAISAKQAATLRYDGTAARWQTVARPAVPGTLLAANNLSELSAKYTACDNLSIHGADVASASTINLETATGNLVDVTGTTTISAITLGDGHERVVRFTGALTLTNGASLVLPGGANITTAAGDFAVFRGYAAGVVRCASYNPAAKADARNLIGATGNLVALTVFTASATWTRAAGTKSVVVEVKGGGGGGGGVGSATGYLSGAGGGEGGIAIKRITSPGATETVTVGAGGTAGANTGGNGGTGGSSSFGAWCSASGGNGGQGNTGSSVVQPGGSGGIGSGGDHNRRGGPGMLNSAYAPGTLAVSGQGGGQGGGASVFSSFPGNAGANGGGGSGASSAQFAGNAAAAGGAGGDGYVMVWEYA